MADLDLSPKHGTEKGMAADYYQILGVSADCGFAELKRAYYRQAKACHPDHHGGDPRKAEAFRRLVEAFNVLSDPLARSAYHVRIPSAPTPAEPVFSPDSILDTMADDILEEMMVGNTIPENTRLQTLMIDLERTERFMLLREAKNLFFTRQVETARRLFEHYLVLAPDNLIARYYVGRCHVLRRRYRQAAQSFADMIRIASRRRPPLHLPRVRRELEKLRQQHLGWWMRWRWAGLGTHMTADLPADEAMRRDVSRAMHHLWRRRAHTSLPQTRNGVSG